MSDQALIVEIKTIADLRAAQAGLDLTLKQIEAAKKSGDGYYHLEERVKSYHAALNSPHAKAVAAAMPKEESGGLWGKLKSVKEGYEDAGGGIKGLASVMSGGAATALAWGAGIASAVGIAAKALSVFAEKQQQVAKLDAVLANSGQLTDEYRIKLQKLAGTMAHETATSGNEWLQVLSTLTKFGADSSNIKEYAEAVKNLAGFMEGGLGEAAHLFGRAMMGNTEMLHRHGIAVDTSKSKLEQLHQVMEQAATRGGGVLESRAHTLAGMWEAFGGSIKKVWFGLGALIEKTELLQIGLSVLTSGLKMLSSVLPDTVKKTEGLANAMPHLKTEAERAATAIGGIGQAAGGMGGVEEHAKSATDALGGEVDALRKVQEHLDQLGDESLKMKMAAIDVFAAKPEFQTVKGKDAIEEMRRKARSQNEREKLEREQDTLKAEKDEAEWKFGKAAEQKRKIEERGSKQLAGLSGEAERLRPDFVQNPQEIAAAARNLKNRIDLLKGQKKFEHDRLQDVLPNGDVPTDEVMEALRARQAKRTKEIEELESKLEKLSKYANAVDSRNKAIDAIGAEVAKPDAELTAATTALQRNAEKQHLANVKQAVLSAEDIAKKTQAASQLEKDLIEKRLKDIEEAKKLNEQLLIGADPKTAARINAVQSRLEQERLQLEIKKATEATDKARAIDAARRAGFGVDAGGNVTSSGSRADNAARYKGPIFDTSTVDAATVRAGQQGQAAAEKVVKAIGDLGTDFSNGFKDLDAKVRELQRQFNNRPK